MSDPFDGETPSADETVSDGDGTRDPAQLQSAADLDEDELAADPLEEGIEPPDDWSRVSRQRPTPSEQSEGTGLDSRLAEQRPDFDAGGADVLDSSPVTDSTGTRDAPDEIGETGGEGAAEEERPIRTFHADVLEAEQVESTGRSASSTEGIEATDPGVVQRAPEEDAERVEDDGR
ncbi:hypothetical protein SAMN04487820_107121 [Actinopolyspora mzabensis]|uniref:DUF5709 domain-containing protein n=1 Tax=Actinopolyspora mzabensis TaxID=995066 RepID=A0A1G9BGD8_ACTMZ|nr:hypothetical protein [Actinopolyspora mzabensis]SDK38114.1 hypothetical protein SAMN04487820_107121 [Actinopolyspora mzabensis]